MRVSRDCYLDRMTSYLGFCRTPPVLQPLHLPRHLTSTPPSPTHRHSLTPAGLRPTCTSSKLLSRCVTFCHFPSFVSSAERTDVDSLMFQGSANAFPVIKTPAIVKYAAEHILAALLVDELTWTRGDRSYNRLRNYRVHGCKSNKTRGKHGFQMIDESQIFCWPASLFCCCCATDAGKKYADFYSLQDTC